LIEAGFIGANEFPFSENKLLNKIPAGILLPEGMRKVRGLTINLVTSNKDRVRERHLKFKAEVETMESAAFFYCCLKTGTPFISIRGISNEVGEEDRSGWMIEKSIQNSCDTLIDILHKNNFFINEA